jgi:hypothetical protein
MKSVYTKWCVKKPQFEALIGRYCVASYYRGFSAGVTSQALKTGFAKSDLKPDFDSMVAFWEDRVLNAELEAKKVQESKGVDVKAREELCKRKQYNRVFTEHVISALGEGLSKNRFNRSQLVNASQQFNVELANTVANQLKSTHPALSQSYDSSKETKHRSSNIRLGKIINEFLAKEQVGQQLPNATLNAHSGNDSLQVLAHAAATQSMGNSDQNTNDRGCRAPVTDVAAGMSTVTLPLMARCRANSCSQNPAQNLNPKIHASASNALQLLQLIKLRKC